MRSGAIAYEYVAHADPDGYTIGLLNTSFTLLPSLTATLKFDPVKSFAPISMLGASPFVLASYPGVPAHTVQDVITLAKAAPGKHTFAEAGPATLANLAGVLVQQDGRMCRSRRYPIAAPNRRYLDSSRAGWIWLT